jgi:hypothetical protein
MIAPTTIEPGHGGELIARFQRVRDDIVTQVRRVIVGQDEVIEQVLIALFVGGHCLITGLPGTAKTLLVRTLAQPGTGLQADSVHSGSDAVRSTGPRSRPSPRCSKPCRSCRARCAAIRTRFSRRS